MDKHAGNYLIMAKVLQKDIELLLSFDCKHDEYRRNFIRTAIPLAGGLCYCFRHFCERHAAEELFPKQGIKGLEGNSSDTACIKSSIQYGYKLFNLASDPEFSIENWTNFLELVKKRDKLLQPATVNDLFIEEPEWQRMYGGAEWLLEVLSDFVSKAAERYGDVE